MLMKAGANPSLMDLEGKSALDYAAANGFEQVCGLMVRRWRQGALAVHHSPMPLLWPWRRDTGTACDQARRSRSLQSPRSPPAATACAEPRAARWTGRRASDQRGPLALGDGDDAKPDGSRRGGGDVPHQPVGHEHPARPTVLVADKRRLHVALARGASTSTCAPRRALALPGPVTTSPRDVPRPPPPPAGALSDERSTHLLAPFLGAGGSRGPCARVCLGENDAARAQPGHCADETTKPACAGVERERGLHAGREASWRRLARALA